MDEKRALLDAYASEVRVTDTTERLASLRACMKTCGVDAYVIGTEDAHGSEYAAECDRRLRFVSGFTGSTATVVVLRDSAHFFTDGRYHVQAQQQLDPNWTLHKVGAADVKDWPAWLHTLPKGSYIGMDATLVPHVEAKALKTSLQAQGLHLAFPDVNLVDDVWGADRPAPTRAPIYEHDMRFAGVEATEKLSALRAWLADQGRGEAAYIVSALDEVAWLLNLRGASIPCNRTYGMTDRSCVPCVCRGDARRCGALRGRASALSACAYLLGRHASDAAQVRVHLAVAA